MKIILILFLIIIPFSLYAQRDTTVTIRKENVAIKEILKDIQSESDFRFFYNAELPELNKTVSVRVRNSGVTETQSRSEIQRRQ